MDRSRDEAQLLRFKFANQGHLFSFFDGLDQQEKKEFIKQLERFNMEDIEKLAKVIAQTELNTVIKPKPVTKYCYTIKSDQEYWSNFESGLKIIAENSVAVVLLSGGQASRLKSENPKGCYNVGLPSQKSLFQLQCERIFKLQQLAAKYSETAVKILLYVLVSNENKSSTKDFFAKHGNFGLQPKNVFFFSQSNLPAMTSNAKLVLERKNKIYMSPNGNGDVFRAMRDKLILKDMKSCKIKHLHFYCVDNCLVKPADPVFLNLAVQNNTFIATKAIEKTAPDESVGVIVNVNERPTVLEYSELPEDLKTERIFEPGHKKKKLKYSEANIVNHYFSLEFLESLSNIFDEMPLHKAKKKVKAIDPQTQQETEMNVIKFEKFIFDIFEKCPLNRFLVYQTSRQDEFSPLKNCKGTGIDDPDTCRESVLLQGKRWLEKAGCTGLNSDGVEVSPLVSFTGEGLNNYKGINLKNINYLESRVQMKKLSIQITPNL